MVEYPCPTKKFVIRVLLVILLIAFLAPHLTAADNQEQSGLDPAYKAENTWYRYSGSPFLIKEDKNIPSIEPPSVGTGEEGVESSTTVMRNLETGRTERYTVRMTESALPPNPSFEGRLPPGTIPIESFSPTPEKVIGTDDRTEVSDTTAWPLRAVVKLYVHWPDGSEGICSGALVDSFHVLTAGHCVYGYDGQGNAIGWADRIEVIPGLAASPDEPVVGTDNSTFDDYYMPYYHAWATYMRSYTEWIDNENRNHDWGLITLDREIGEHIGWFGYNYHDLLGGCKADYYDNGFNTAGYPGDKGSWPHPEMYFDYDYGCHCSSTKHWYKCDTEVGQSGMPVWLYDSDSGNRWIATVHAYDGGTDGHCSGGSNSGTRLNESKVNDLESWMNEDSAPTDLPILIDDGQDYSGFSPKTIGSGETLDVWSDFRNIGTASSGGFYISYYASTNDNITTSDYLLCESYVFSINPFIREDSSCSLSFPDDIPSGEYYVGWIIDRRDNVSQKESLEDTYYKPSSYGKLQVEEDPQLCISPDPADHDFGRMSKSSPAKSSPDSWSFTVENCGGQTLNWSASPNDGWISLSPTSGSLSGGNSEQVTVTVDTSGLSYGSHTGDLDITNGTTKDGDISLYVNEPPQKPYDPSPSDGANNVDTGFDVCWQGSDSDGYSLLQYDVWFEKNDSTPDDKVCSNNTSGCCNVSLDSGSQYYWKVRAEDGIDSTTSPTWEFETEAAQSDITTLAEGWNLFSPPGIPENPDPANALGDDVEPLSLYYDYSAGNGYTVYPSDTDTTELDWKQGYWIYLTVESQVDMATEVPDQNQTLEFTDQGWKLIGLPYSTDWSQVSFSDPTDFQTDGAEHVRLVSWDPTEGTYYNHYSDTSYVLSPWLGYWIKVKQAYSSDPASITVTETNQSATAVGTRTPLPQSVDRSELDYPPLPQRIAGKFRAFAYPNPVMQNDYVTFTARMVNVEKMKATVANTAGKVIYDSGYKSGNKLTWNLNNTSGSKVANGIYLYKIQVTGIDGTTQASEVRRLLVLR